MQLQLFSKAPVPGVAKTRLIPQLGREGAAQLQQQMTHWMVEQAIESRLGQVVLYAVPDVEHPSFVALQQRYGISLKSQQGIDLGERMEHAIEQGLQQHDAVLLMGCDCPQLEAARLDEVVVQLHSHEVVLVPAVDGGYVLVAMKRLVREIFHEIDWGTNRVFQQTVAQLDAQGVSWYALPAQEDIDQVEDLQALPEAWKPEYAI